ncbi:MAG: FAD-dependent oxidoreductase [Candidatus Micrarchaeota archaeon]
MIYLHDVLIIGAGPAGMSAALYAARRGLSVLLLEGSTPGGAMATASHVENYIGIPSISGPDLTKAMVEHLEKFNIHITSESVMEIHKEGNTFSVRTAASKTYTTRSLIIATGAYNKKLDVPGEKEFLGKGVSYCSTCDATFFQGMKVAVIGGGNTALSSALTLSQIASKVYLIHRRNEFRGDKVLQKQLEGKVTFILETVPVEILGNENGTVGKIKLKNVNTNKEIDLEVDGVFVNIGEIPSSELAKQIGVHVSPLGQIHVNAQMETNVPGVLAAGDVTGNFGNLRQIITACGQGALAAVNAHMFLTRSK